jgi:hypothetical protein
MRSAVILFKSDIFKLLLQVASFAEGRESVRAAGHPSSGIGLTAGNSRAVRHIASSAPICVSNDPTTH